MRIGCGAGFSSDRLDPPVNVALLDLVARATAADPGARHPSADELASALRRAARLAEPTSDQRGLAWPILGLDAPATALLAHVGGLRRGGGIVITSCPR